MDHLMGRDQDGIVSLHISVRGNVHEYHTDVGA
jgi:hypothetical protein